MGNCNSIADMPPEVKPKEEDLSGEMKEFASLIGIENTLKLCRTYNGCNVYIPSIDFIIRDKRNNAIRADYDKGLTVNQLGKKYRLSNRQIWNILSHVD